MCKNWYFGISLCSSSVLCVHYYWSNRRHRFYPFIMQSKLNKNFRGKHLWLLETFMFSKRGRTKYFTDNKIADRVNLCWTPFRIYNSSKFLFYTKRHFFTIVHKSDVNVPGSFLCIMYSSSPVCWRQAEWKPGSNSACFFSRRCGQYSRILKMLLWLTTGKPEKRRFRHEEFYLFLM